METQQKIIKKVIKTPSTETKQNNNIKNVFRVLNVVMFLMVFIIFARGFNIKNTIREENTNTQKLIKEQMLELQTKTDLNRQIDKSEILGSFALYSRLSKDELKQKEDENKQDQMKYQNMANQYNQGLNSLTKQIKSSKDSIK